MFFSSKQSSAYLIPVFLAIDIFNGIILFVFIKNIFLYLNGRISIIRKKILLKIAIQSYIFFIILLIFLCQSAIILSYHPYYGFYRNFCYSILLDKINLSKKFRAFDLGWGEGIERAVIFLNNKDDAEKLKIASSYPGVASVFSKGEIVHINFWGEADYLIFYVKHIHHDRFSDLVKKTIYNKNIKAEYIVKFRGRQYAWVYKTEDILN